MKPNEARVLVHLEQNGPQTMIDLYKLPRIKSELINILKYLLEAGLIEWCAIGQGGGVKALTPGPSPKRREGEISEVQTQAGVVENVF